MYKSINIVLYVYFINCTVGLYTVHNTRESSLKCRCAWRGYVTALNHRGILPYRTASAKNQPRRPGPVQYPRPRAEVTPAVYPGVS